MKAGVVKPCTESMSSLVVIVVCIIIMFKEKSEMLFKEKSERTETFSEHPPVMGKTCQNV